MGNVARHSASPPMTARAFLKRMLCTVSLLGFVVLSALRGPGRLRPSHEGDWEMPLPMPEWANRLD